MRLGKESKKDAALWNNLQQQVHRYFLGHHFLLWQQLKKLTCPCIMCMWICACMYARITLLEVCTFAPLHLCNFASWHLCAFANLQHVQFATRPICNMSNLQHVQFATRPICNMSNLQYVLFTWSLCHCAYLKIDLSVCTLLKLPSPTKDMFNKVVSSHSRIKRCVIHSFYRTFKVSQNLWCR